MGIRLDRRRRIAAGLAALAAAIWLLCGLKRVPDDDGRAAVLDSPLGFVDPVRAAPGWHLVPPGLLRLSFYPVRAVTLSIPGRIGTEPLRTRDGSDVDADLLLRYRVDDDRLFELHRRLGPRYEQQGVALWAREALRQALGSAAYSEVSGERTSGVQDAIGRALADRLRDEGLVLQSCEVGRIRLRHPAAGEAATGPLPAGRVLVVGFDGADWNVIDPLRKAGRMPRLDKLVREGVRSRLKTISPMLSPVLWTSMATGVVPQRHGILDFVVSTGRDGEEAPVSSAQRRVKAFWNILSERGLSVGVTGWWATAPAEQVNGYIVSDRVAYQLIGVRPVEERDRRGKVSPPADDDAVVAATVAPDAVTPADLEPFVRNAGDLSGLSDKETRLVDDLRTAIASGRTYTAAALALEARHHADLTAVYFEGTDTVAHLFMPYAPPPLPGIDAAAQRRFGRAVDAEYEEADRLLGRLIDGITPATVVVLSDHGFRTGDNRPRTESRPGYGIAADWHRQYGIAVFNGPAFRRGVELDEVSLLDIAPTLLRLVGLPVGEDMDGRPVADAFDPAWLRGHPDSYIASWEKTAGGTTPTVMAAAAPVPPGSPDPVRATAPGSPVASASGSVVTPAPKPAVAPAVAAAGDGTADAEGDAERIEKLRSLGYIAGTGSPNAHNNRGAALLFQGRAQEALAEFQQAIAAHEDLSIARLNMARARIELRDYDGALQDIATHVQRQPRSRDAEYLRGRIAERRGHPDEAESDYQAALAIDPNFTEARNDLGLLRERQGRHDEALAEFRRVVTIDPEFGEAYNNIGIVLRGRGEKAAAADAFRRAIKATPGFAGAYSNLAVLLEDDKEYAEAETLLRQAVQHAPKDADIRSNLGALLHLMGRDEEAVRELERASALDPKSASAFNNLGTALGQLGRTAEEVAAYRRAVSLDRNSAEAHYNLGRVLQRNGQEEEGRVELEAARDLKPKDPDLVRRIEEALAEGDSGAGAPAGASRPESSSGGGR
ncbi:MAG TPA: tetratricopeptide repeat protein [Verrucomicrobiae bacterium]|nr:tetratricopeptide repeat protein [Verrucomicrobiae bacterium]